MNLNLESLSVLSYAVAEEVLGILNRNTYEEKKSGSIEMMNGRGGEFFFTLTQTGYVEFAKNHAKLINDPRVKKIIQTLDRSRWFKQETNSDGGTRVRKTGIFAGVRSPINVYEFRPNGGLNLDGNLADLLEKDTSPIISVRSFQQFGISDKIYRIEYDSDFDLNVFAEELANDPDIYGILFSSADENNKIKLFNPWHPLIQLGIASGLKIGPDTNGIINVFRWNPNFKEQILEIYGGEEKLQELIDIYVEIISEGVEILAANIKAVQIKESVTAWVDDEMPFEDSLKKYPYLNVIGDEKITIKTEQLSPADAEDGLYILTPTFYASGGAAWPYYSQSFMRRSGPIDPVIGFSLGPMANGNVKFSYYTGNDFLAGDSVCTGDHQSVRPDGWLTHSGLGMGSMFYSNLIDVFLVYPYTEALKKVSGSMLSVINTAKDKGGE